MRKLISALTVPTGLALLVIPVPPPDAPPPPSITSSQTAMSPGQTLIVANQGAHPGATVTFTLDRSWSSAVTPDHHPIALSGNAPGRLVLGRAIAADDGSFRASVTIPPGTEPGVYTLVSVTDRRQLGAIAVRVESDASAVTGIPFSGAAVLPGLLVGAGLILAGGLLLLGVQYRRSSIA
jgi:hypothetical protein